jgi:primosomal protein N' (replication factor Y)
MTKLLLRIAVPTPLRRYFDYLPADNTDVSSLRAGMRVQVPFHRRKMVGVFIETVPFTKNLPYKLKPIIEVIDQEPVIPAEIMKLATWAAEYYHYPIGEVLLGALPSLLRQGKRAEFSKAKELVVASEVVPPLILNPAQAAAVHAIKDAQQQFHTFLLDGVTGSGKTEVYLQAIGQMVADNFQVLVLVPEIGLTPQTVQRFQTRFAVPVLALHSRMTARQRLHAWLNAKLGRAKIVIGTRSAIFTPFANLGLIIVDEEHDLSFKQQESFRYHARDVAIMRAHYLKIPIVLGSATPSLETLYNAKQGRYTFLALPERAGTAVLPEFELLDVRKVPLEEGLAPAVLVALGQHLQQGNQVMVFLNRRGYAPVLICHSCGWMAKCKRCDARMTYHHLIKRLHCHHCDTKKALPLRCENCQDKNLQTIGQGTERLEDILAKHFPKYAIARIDKDTTKHKDAMEDALAAIQRGDQQILIGTQMLAKGHHFPNVTLVVVVDADGGFFSADFRSLERMGQLVLQVAGRSGREKKRGKVIIQTHYPDHPLLHQLLKQSYGTFADSLLQERADAQLPPHVFFALFRADAHSAAPATEFLQNVRAQIDTKNPHLHLSGPVPAPMPKRAGRYRMQLLLQAKQRPVLQQLLNELLPKIEAMAGKHRVRWSLDVDPLEIF